MKTSTAFAHFDEVCGTLLVSHNFSRNSAGDYSRVSGSGLDRILVDKRAGRGRFVVFVGYFPKDLEFVYDLSDAKEPRGFPVGPFLGFMGVSVREYIWSEKSLDSVKGAKAQLVVAIESHGLPWLDKLRDSSFFATQVDKSAVLYAAVAYERAGLFLDARHYYEVMYKRLCAGLSAVSELQFIRTAGKRFAFVARKLGRDQDFVERIERILGWSCPALPI